MASDEDETSEALQQREEHDPQFWRDLAEETRGMMRKLSDPEAIGTLLRIADKYEHLAQLAETR